MNSDNVKNPETNELDWREQIRRNREDAAKGEVKITFGSDFYDALQSRQRRKQGNSESSDLQPDLQQNK